MENDVSVRDLRNRTAQVLDGVESGDTVFITRNGERIAALTSLTNARHPANARLLAYLDAQTPSDSGWLEEYLAEKAVAAEFEAERAVRVGLV